MSSKLYAICYCLVFIEVAGEVFVLISQTYPMVSFSIPVEFLRRTLLLKREVATGLPDKIIVH